jgi:hypothetical protein
MYNEIVIFTNVIFGVDSWLLEWGRSKKIYRSSREQGVYASRESWA